MTLATIVLYIALAAVLLTLATHFWAKRTRNLGMSFLQNFCGAWFLFSGYIKVADPLGTAYKMEQYFSEFSFTAAGAGVGFLEPLFGWASSVSVYVAMFMVVLEVVLGLMLVLGTRPPVTRWLFLAVMLFFTILTGFTFLTGYVPTESNFFAFADWGPYVSTNMRVTDCGCFGDFLKLDPYVSYLKDCALLVPAVLFVLFPGSMHRLFTQRVRAAAPLTAAGAAVLFGLSNFYWGLPIHDFRPFAEGVDIRERKRAEAEALADVELDYRLTSRATGEVTVLPVDAYLEAYKDYPKEEYELEQVPGEPAVAQTKISDFELEDETGNAVVEDLLREPGYSVLVVAYKLYDEGVKPGERTVEDSLFVAVDPDEPNGKRVFAGLRERSETGNMIAWNESYLEHWSDHIVPFAAGAEAAGWKVYAATAFTDPARVADFREAARFPWPIYRGDDLLLKTIIRANPGVVVLKDGVVVRKFHYAELPRFSELSLQ